MNEEELSEKQIKFIISALAAIILLVTLYILYRTFTGIYEYVRIDLLVQMVTIIV